MIIREFLEETDYPNWPFFGYFFATVFLITFAFTCFMLACLVYKTNGIALIPFIVPLLIAFIWKTLAQRRK